MRAARFVLQSSLAIQCALSFRPASRRMAQASGLCYPHRHADLEIPRVIPRAGQRRDLALGQLGREPLQPDVRKSGAKATRTPNASRLPGVCETREALGVRACSPPLCSALSGRRDARPLRQARGPTPHRQVLDCGGRGWGLTPLFGRARVRQVKTHPIRKRCQPLAPLPPQSKTLPRFISTHAISLRLASYPL